MTDDRRIPLRPNRREESSPSPSGSTSCIVPSVASYAPSGSWRVMNIDKTTSMLSSTSHFLGCCSSRTVFERRRSKLAQAAVDSRRIGLEDGSPCRIHRGDRPLGLGRGNDACESGGPRRSHALRRALKARRRLVVAPDPSGKTDPARAESRSRAQRPRVRRPSPLECRERLA